MVNFDGEIKRMDLALRSENVEFETIIYKISDRDYLIYSEQYPDDLDALQAKFDQEIRRFGTSVKLTKSPVSDYLAIVPPISDKEIPKNFEGMAMNTFDLYNLLLIKFPDVNIYKISGAQPIVIHVYSLEEKTTMGTIHHYISKEQRARLLEFVNNLGIATTWEIAEDKMDTAPELVHELVQNPIQFLNSNKLWKKNTGEYSERDEALWFDNIDDIYNGKFRKEHLYFYHPDDYACYVDYTTGDHIDIRNFLLLYQTVYITPPFDKNIKAWLAKQRIKEEEYLELVAKGRIKIILTQPESRYEMALFNEMYKLAPNSIITRRAIAALQQIDVIEIADNFLFNDPIMLKALQLFAEKAAPTLGFDPKLYYEMMTWPIKARRSSFDYLNYKGVYSTSAFGVNNFVSKIIERRLGKNCNFEYSISATSIHVAHALNATYYPYRNEHHFSDAFYAHTMGIYLNMFKLTTPKHIQLLSKTDDKLPVTPLPLNPIDIIDVDTYIPILEFEALMQEGRAYPSGKRLMETLAPLNLEERAKKIDIYNKLVMEEVKKQKNKEFKIDLATNIALDGIGFVSQLAGLGTVYSFLRKGGTQVIKHLPEIKKINDIVEDKYYADPDKANVHFLTRINRVAGLKRF